MPSKLTGSLILVLLAVASPVCPTFYQNRNFYCQNIDTSLFAINATERTSLRSTYSFTLSLSQNSAFSSWEAGSLSVLFSGSGFFLIIVLLFDLAALGSAIAFAVGNCACLPRPPFLSEKAKAFWLSALLVWLLAIACTVAILVYLGNVRSGFPTMICGLSTAGFQIVDGLSTSSGQFVGFKTYSNLLTSFRTDLATLPNANPNFVSIQSAALGASAETTSLALKTFFDKYSTSTTSNSTGGKSVPYIIGNFTNGTVSAEMGAQFATYTSIATRLDNSSGTATGLTQTQLESLNSALLYAAPLYTNMSAGFELMFNYGSDNITSVQTNLNLVFWSILIGQCVCLFFTFVAFTCLMRMAFQGDCLKRVKVVRWLLFIAGVLTFALGAIGVANAGISLLLNTVCGVSQTLLVAPATTPTVFDLPNAGSTAKILAHCMVNRTASQMSSLISANSTQLSQMEMILDGVTLYSTGYQTTVTDNTPAIISSITSTINKWTTVYNGIRFDQPNILTTYNTFVRENNQSDVQYVFNRLNCTIGNCFVIQNTTNFTPSENANNITYVSQLFKVLQDYIKSEISLIDSMVNDLTGSVSGTPNSALKSTMNKLVGQAGNVTAVKQALSNSISTVASFRGGLLNYTNCTSIESALGDLEVSSCFSFRFDMLILALIFLGAIIVQLVMLWLIWGGLRHVKEQTTIEYGTTEEMTMMGKGEGEKSTFGKKGK